MPTITPMSEAKESRDSPDWDRPHGVLGEKGTQIVLHFLGIALAATSAFLLAVSRHDLAGMELGGLLFFFVPLGVGVASLLLYVVAALVLKDRRAAFVIAVVANLATGLVLRFMEA